MTVSGLNYKTVKYPKEGDTKIYYFLANDGYVFFKGDTQKIVDEETGEETTINTYRTAFSLLANEIEELNSVECVIKLDDMVVI